MARFCYWRKQPSFEDAFNHGEWQQHVDHLFDEESRDWVKYTRFCRRERDQPADLVLSACRQLCEKNRRRWREFYWRLTRTCFTFSSKNWGKSSASCNVGVRFSAGRLSCGEDLPSRAQQQRRIVHGRRYVRKRSGQYCCFYGKPFSHLIHICRYLQINCRYL